MVTDQSAHNAGKESW